MNQSFKNIDNIHTSCEVVTQEKMLQTELSIPNNQTMSMELF